MKQLFHATVLAAALIALAAGCKSSGEEVEVLTPVTPITLKDTTCTVESYFPATLRGVQDVDIYPTVEARIKKVFVIEGQNVRKGDVLFKQGDVSIKADLEAARAQQAVAEAQVETAKLTAESKYRLFSKGVISEYQYKVARNALMTAKADLQKAEAAVKKAANQLSLTEVKAPVSGVIGTLPYKEGSLVGPMMTTPLTVVSDNSEMFADFSIQENVYLMLADYFAKTGNLYTKDMSLYLVTNDGKRYPHKGKVHSASGVISAQTGALPMIAKFPNPDRILISGGSARVVISGEQSGTILIPRTSIKEIQNKMFVFVIKDDSTLSQVEIRASRYNNVYWMLEPSEDGNYAVKAGDRITATTNRLTDGMKVEVK